MIFIDVLSFLLRRSTASDRLPMKKRNDSVTCAARPAKIFRESHLTKAVHQHLSMRLPGLTGREVQSLECFVAGISSMPSILPPERILSSAGSLSAIGRQDRRIEESKFCGIFQQLDYAFEQTT